MTNAEFGATPQSAVDLADSYQRGEFLLEVYPTYGIDRVLLENYHLFEDHLTSYTERSLSHNHPVGIMELFEARTADAPMHDYSGYRIGRNDAKLTWLFHQWHKNYLLPRAPLASEDAELDAWKLYCEGKDITTDDVGVRRSDASDFRKPRLVLEDTHLVPGYLYGGSAMHFIVPPGVKLSGHRGHCTVLDTTEKALRDKYVLPEISPNVLEILRSDGYIAPGRKTTQKEIARSALSDW